MSEADILGPEPPAPGGRQRTERRRRFLRQLSDRTPLRTKLITAVLGLVFIALTAISVASTYMLRQYLTTQHDGSLISTLNYFNATGNIPHNLEIGSVAPTQSNIVVGIQEPGSQLSWGQFNLPGMASPDPLPRLPTNGLWPGPHIRDTSPIFSAPAQIGPNTWRVVAETVSVTHPITGQTTNVILVVAEDLGNIHALTFRLVLFDAIVDGVILVVLATVGAGIVQANLRPLNDIELTAGQIAAGHLDHRVPEGNPRTEIGSLGRSLNAMLTQIETAFHAQEESEQAAHRSEERMRRFIADASHELRTPLTTIRGFAAHYRMRGGAHGVNGDAGPAGGTGPEERITPARTDALTTTSGNGAATAGPTAPGMSAADLDHLMGRVEAEATRMGILVEDLLTLARLDQQRPLNLAPVDLLTLAADAVQDARIVSPERSIDLTVAPGAAFLVDGDEPRLRQVLANLVNNALTHTPAGTPVRVKIAPGTLAPPDATAGGPNGTADATAGGPNGTAGGTAGSTAGSTAGGTAGSTAPPDAGPDGLVPAVVLDIEDDGPGMTPEQAHRVFERFYRADAARNRASGGTGLGLAIVASLVAAHGGTVSLRTAPGQGADFQVRLPLSPDARPPDDSGEDA